MRGLLRHIVEGESKHIVLDEKTVSYWLKNEGLGVGMRRIAVGLIFRRVEKLRV